MRKVLIFISALVALTFGAVSAFANTTTVEPHTKYRCVIIEMTVNGMTTKVTKENRNKLNVQNIALSRYGDGAKSYIIDADGARLDHVTTFTNNDGTNVEMYSDKDNNLQLFMRDTEELIGEDKASKVIFSVKSRDFKATTICIRRPVH